MTAVQVQAAGHAATVVSSESAVTDWVHRYCGPWWDAELVAPEAICMGPTLTATLDATSVRELTERVTSGDHDEVTYAKARLLVAHQGEDTITATSPDEGLVYQSYPDVPLLNVWARDEQSLSLAAARLIREMVRAALLRDGWTLLHASAVALPDGRAVLAFGGKGAGKSTTAMLLASPDSGVGLLANDRVFARVEGDQLRVVPWPAAAAIGLGLLDALGWFDLARARLRAGDQLHPTQHPAVTEAILEGRRTPLWEPNGQRERKAQLFPDHFVNWFGMRLATEGRAALLLFPRVDLDVGPAVEDGARTLADGDFMSRSTEDRYPDVFGLARGIDQGGAVAARAAAAGALAMLPRRRIVLGADVRANAEVLGKVVQE
jgi:hypothetical protein